MTIERRRPRVSIDTNVFVSSIISGRGPTYAIVQAVYRGDLILIMSREQYDEVIDVLQRPQLQRFFSESDVGLLRNQLGIIDLFDHTGPPPVNVRDSKDEGILAAALAGNADYLITGDDDLMVLATEPTIAPLQIINPRQFVEFLNMEADL